MSPSAQTFHCTLFAWYFQVKTYEVSQPLSTDSSAPLTDGAVARKRMALAISSALHAVPIGMHLWYGVRD